MAVSPKKFTWSYSALSDFKLCPLKLRETRILRRKSDQNAYNTAGNQDHKAFENRALSHEPLPPHLKKYEKGIDLLTNIKGIKTPELELAVTADWQSTGWSDFDAWGRAKLDLSILYNNGLNLAVFDWKFGRWRSDDRWLQLDISNVIASCFYPDVEQFRSALVWVTQRFDVEPRKMSRDMLPVVKAAIMARVDEYADAYENDDFPPRQNFLCKQHCPVTDCKFNGRDK